MAHNQTLINQMQILAASPAPGQIAEARKSLGLTQSKAAKLLHANLRTWQKWEGGENRMHPAFWELFQLKASNGVET